MAKANWVKCPECNHGKKPDGSYCKNCEGGGKINARPRH